MYDQLEQYCIDNRDKFYRLAYSYVRNQEDALDIVSESILKALTNKKKIKDKEAVKTWLYRIIVNTSLDFLRKEKKDLQIIKDKEAAETWGFDEYLNIDLQNAMDILPDSHRIIIILRFFEDMKIENIALLLDENVNTIKSRLYSSLKKLRIQMDEESYI